MVPGPGGLSSGFSLIELLFSMAITGTVTAMAVTQGLRALDDVRVRSAARYLAHGIGARSVDARITAAMTFSLEPAR